MMRKALFLALALCAGSAWGALDINQADVAALDGVRGIGPSMSRKIIAEREQGKFKNWADLMARVQGIKDKTAAKFSSQGLTVDGQPFPEIVKSEP